MKTCRDCKRFIGLFRVESKDQNGNPLVWNEFRCNRPFKNCKELCDFWYTKTAVNVPSYAMPLIWVKRKSANCTMLITAFNDDTSISIAVGNIVIYTLAGLLKEFTFLDGTPCGVEVSE